MLVVDASVALRWYVNGPGSASAVSLLTEDAVLVAPDLIVAEVCNSAWKLVKAGEITPTTVPGSQPPSHPPSPTCLALASSRLVPTPWPASSIIRCTLACISRSPSASPHASSRRTSVS